MPSLSHSSTTVAAVDAIRLHPIKACQPISVLSATIGPAGFLYDRVWAVVDVHGTRHPKGEYLSQRKLPKLATIGVALDHDNGVLVVTAPDMPELRVPLEEDAYMDNDTVDVQCCGVSTTDGGGWHLGSCLGYSAGEAATEWFTTYLNRPTVHKSKKPPATYCLVRSPTSAARPVSTFAGPRQQKTSPFRLWHIPVVADDRVVYQDFAPYLLVTRESIADLNQRMGTATYPIESFRGNIVIRGAPAAWDEEDWSEFDINGIQFRFLKECPRCTVPGRNQQTGEYHFAGGEYDGVKGALLTPQNTLSKAFPDKAADPTWGTWSGPFFGCYVASDPKRVGAVVSVGDTLVVRQRRGGRWSLRRWGTGMYWWFKQVDTEYVAHIMSKHPWLWAVVAALVAWVLAARVAPMLSH
eukprot:m.105684 g.105684  ORF g.105684 m.105684 type:complete len:410 (+) comp10560_c0_seq1:1227-2456(+)